ncbi:MAG TPA: CopG family transcriptional regulator [Streptosporangiaceae bacterium]|nr:CopG family transcriptional regulator [Streptosporangiaceae bacterium]
MATKKYTVTLPEDLAEEIRAEVGSGGFSRYVAQAIERQRERDHLHEFVGWWEGEHGGVTDEELAGAEAERLAVQGLHADRKARSVPDRKAG